MLDLSSLRNPFRDNVVRDAWQEPPDVEAIHERVFRDCLAGIESARQGLSDSLLIYGPAGSGKTHLLTRLQRHLRATSQQAPDSALHCVFVFVRLQTSRLLLWQHVRGRLARDLLREEQGLTQLQRLVAHQLATCRGEKPRAAILRLRVLGHEDQETVANHLAEVAQRLELPRDLALVLEHLVCNRWVRDAAAWLAGESLPEETLRRLGLGLDTAEDREQAAREVVSALCRLAGETLPIVFCFDQVEALQQKSDDRDAFFQFGRMAADLYDSDSNLFLITCMQSSVIDPFRAAVLQADQARMARRHAVLENLSHKQVEALIESRLRLVPELKQLQEQGGHGRLFPFCSGLVDELVRNGPCVPRSVLDACCRRFEELQCGRPPPTKALDQYLTEQFETRRAERARRLEPGQLTPILMKSVEVLATLGRLEVSDRDPEHADLVFEGERKAAVSIRNEVDGRSLWPKFKKLLSHVPRSDGKRLVILRDARLGISQTATKTRQALVELQARGAVLAHPSPEALAALDALASLLSDAKSGDLSKDGTTIEQGRVLDWLKRLQASPASGPVTELLDSILESSRTAPLASEREDLAELLQAERVIAVEEAARRLGWSPARVLEVAYGSPQQILVLTGSPDVLVDVAGIAAEAGT